MGYRATALRQENVRTWRVVREDVWKIRWEWGQATRQGWGSGSSVSVCPRRNSQYNNLEGWRGLTEARAQSWRHSRAQAKAGE